MITMMQWTGAPFGGIFKFIGNFEWYITDQSNRAMMSRRIKGIERICHIGEWVIADENGYFRDLDYLEEYKKDKL